MSKTYFGFAISDSMFGETDCTINRRVLTIDEVDAIINSGVEVCLNPSHKATIKAMNTRYGFKVAIPETAPNISLKQGDSLLVMGVRGLPRLEGRHEYTEMEIDNATFVFSLYTVVS